VEQLPPTPWDIGEERAELFLIPDPEPKMAKAMMVSKAPEGMLTLILQKEKVDQRIS
jgi:hypothetical protein